MTSLPNPFESGASSCTPDKAAASISLPPTRDAAADLSDIGQIFIGAAKLEPPEIWFENSAYPREDELLFEVLEAMVTAELLAMAHDGL